MGRIENYEGTSILASKDENTRRFWFKDALSSAIRFFKIDWIATPQGFVILLSIMEKRFFIFTF